MTNYVLTYHGEAQMPTDPAEIQETMEQWGQWYGMIGDRLVDGGSPFARHWGVGPDGSAVDAPAALSGYTVVQAADQDEAIEIAKGCPVLANGHTVQVSESLDMSGE